MLVNNVKSIGMFGLKMELLAIGMALAVAMNRTATCPIVDSSSDKRNLGTVPNTAPHFRNLLEGRTVWRGC